MSVDREPFRVEGVGCWCPGDFTLQQVRITGHSTECTKAREGWRRNYDHLSGIDRQRRADQEVGRQIREAAPEIVARTGHSA